MQGLFGSGNANDAGVSAVGTSTGASMPVSAVQRQVMLQQMALNKQSGMHEVFDYWWVVCSGCAHWDICPGCAHWDVCPGYAHWDVCPGYAHWDGVGTKTLILCLHPF